MSYVHQTHFFMSQAKGGEWAIFQVFHKWGTKQVCKMVIINILIYRNAHFNEFF